MPIAISEEQQAVQASIRDWAKRAGTLAMVRGLEPGTPAGAGPDGQPGGPPAATPGGDYWDTLAGLGIFSIALSEEVGGDGGTVTDLAAAIEELAHALAPGPVMPTALAGAALRDHVHEPPAKDLLPALAAGQASVAVGLTAGTLTGSWLADGRLRVTGEAGPVLGAGSASHLLLSALTDRAGAGGGGGVADQEVWFLLAAGHLGAEVMARTPVDFSRTLATIRLDGVIVGPGQLLSELRTTRVRDLAATLFAAEAAAVAGYCTDTAAAYARTREQFGRPIGSFQAVKHLCAAMLCRAERACALAWDAARAVDEAPEEHPLAAAAAAALALDAAVDNAKDCIQVLGGTGFTWEHDAHLYLRRALALRQLLGGSALWRRRAAELAMAGARRRLRLGAGGAGGGGDLDAEPAAVAARSLAATVAGLPADQRRAALAEAGYVAPQWPAPYGLSASPAVQLVIDEELNAAGVSRPDLAIGGWAGQAIISHGSPAQRERFAGPTLRGEITWCQLFSEPEAGSDLASVRTRAERVTGDSEEGMGRRVGDGGWRLTGQKVWTSLAREADWGICLARTDPAAPKHRGLTFFLVDMHSDGIDIRPLREITGRAVFNEVFLDQVFVPDDCVVGQCGEGWRVARSTLASERVAMGRGSALGDAVEGLIDAVRDGELAADPGVREQLGALVADGLAGSLLDLRSALAQLRGVQESHQAAVRKLVGVAHRQSVAETAVTLCGPDGAASDGAAAAAVHEFLLTRCLSIAGGTSQILLSMVAERALGLPREEMR
ncbi:MAG TPA: acyl-CoA dehydrogenase [Streptosporangiaceae bacterium]|nr:acyl-CoA dehydrogenase [Streptosporangiaceae bacterium]